MKFSFMGSLTYNKIKEYLGMEEEKSKIKSNKPGNGTRRKKSKNALDKKSIGLKILVFGGIFLSLVIVVGLIGFSAMVIAYSKQLPPPGKPFSKDITQNSNVYDKKGVLLASLHGSTNREWVSLTGINQNMQNAMLAAEDANFYNEPGFDLFAIIRAGILDLLHHGSSLQGASTITQQLVKITSLSSNGVAPRTLQRKIQEIILTLEVERQYSKSDILQAYLNNVSFGGDNAGIKVASEEYFNLEPDKLDLAQSAFLAGLVQAPSYYSPIFGDDPILKDGSQAHFGRTYYVLNEILKHKDQFNVSQSQIDAAKEEVKNFKFNTNFVSLSGYKAPHFVQYVENILKNNLGFTDAQIHGGGLQITTSLDYSMQQIAEDEVNRLYSDFNDSKKPYKFNGDDAAMVSIDPKTGEILAMVGAPKNGTQVNIVTSSNGLQPGSSIKPLLYMSAFKNLGMAPTTYMPDFPISIDSYNGYKYPTPYAPSNFQNEQIPTDINIDNDLTDSLNRPAVMTLYSLGLKNFVGDLKTMGYSGLTGDESSSNLSYAIGGENVVFLDHVNAYATIANEGTLYPSTAVTKVADSSGKVLYQYDPISAGKKVIDSAYPYMITSMLNHYKFLRKWGNYLFTEGYNVAGKTGTNNTVDSNGNPDNASSVTFVGYSPNVVSGFWYGNQKLQGKALEQHTAGYPPSGEFIIPYWADYMNKILPKYSKDNFARPSDIVEKQVCADTGLLYIDGKTQCSPTTGVFQKDHLPKEDDEHIQVNVCPNQQDQLATPDMVSSGQSLQKTVVAYKTYDTYFESMLDQFLNNSNKVPNQYCTSSSGLSVALASPADGSSYSSGAQVNVKANVVEINSTNTISGVDVYFNNQKYGSLTLNGTSYSGTFNIPATTQTGTYPVDVRATDSGGAIKDAIVNIFVSSSNTTTDGGNTGNGSNNNGGVNILSPTNGSQVNTNPMPTVLSFSFNGTGTNPLFNIYNGGSIIATVTSNISQIGNIWSTTYKFPKNTSSNAFQVEGCITSNGASVCNRVNVTAQ